MKGKRQEVILQLIKEKIYLTQEDLQSELIRLGYNVTQSTVSRDIKELRIVKGHDSEGNYRYIASETTSGTG
ncbi:MAG: arginine repressor, partial [Acutalibacteraceae bacterium]|nr:arginine repressor [Acutalibacteraceae bacterium]